MLENNIWSARRRARMAMTVTLITSCALAQTEPTEVPPPPPSVPQLPIIPSTGATQPAGIGPASATGAVTHPAEQPAGVAPPATTAAVATPSPGAAATPAAQPVISSQAVANRLANITVTSELDQQRDQIAPPLGATTYTQGAKQIDSVPGGENASFQQVLLRAPGVVADSFGQVHVRGEHADITYRVNGVLLPEPLNGFGQEVDTRLIQNVTLIDGSLPAQFGFRTAAVVDIQTKSGGTLQGNELSLYGGSYTTFIPSLQVGGTDGKLDYFFTLSHDQNSIGIENPTDSLRPIHDDTTQDKFFGYASYRIDTTSRISLLVNASYADFQIPDTPGLAQQFSLANHPHGDSATVDENQNEQNYYTVLSYQQSVDDLSLQLSGFTSFGQIDFRPDNIQDLIFQGVAGHVFNSFFTNGVQGDASYVLNDSHTLRFGVLADDTIEDLNTKTLVFPVNGTGSQPSELPNQILDNSRLNGVDAGIYVQDEWQVTRELTVNYGVRYDHFDSSFDHEGQLSPRVNLVYKIDPQTTAHVGYARYFAPPTVQYTSPSTIDKFRGTTNAPQTFQDDPLRAERSNYYDVGISRQITKPWTVNVDAFYKQSRNLLDLGQFGDAVILSPFNYRYGWVYGPEVSSTYTEGGLSVFGNFAYVQTQATHITSSQYQFDVNELDYINDHDIHLDHQSGYTASGGISYAWKHDRVYLDMLFGSGLRIGFANLQHESPYYPVNLGYEHVFHPNALGGNTVRLRFDVVNVFDHVYQLRQGGGLGVEASQYGQRRGYYVGLAYDF
jgi:outer membrane receptor protein involved in Fe transport